MVESFSHHDEYVLVPYPINQSSSSVDQIVYIPTVQPPKPPPSTSSSSSTSSHLQSFACPITHVHDTRVTAPWFGPNEVLSLIQPVPNGGIPPHHPAIKLTLTFRDGGAYDFHTKFVQVKERLQQALEVRGMSGMGADGGSAGQAEALAVISADVTLEDLPAYEETASVRAPVVNAQEAMIVPQARRVQRHEESSIDLGPATTTTTTTAARAPSNVPADAPPGYEEAQSGGVSRALDR